MAVLDFQEATAETVNLSALLEMDSQTAVPMEFQVREIHFLIFLFHQAAAVVEVVLLVHQEQVVLLAVMAVLMVAHQIMLEVFQEMQELAAVEAAAVEAAIQTQVAAVLAALAAQVFFIFITNKEI
jgi:hypothetical protein